MACGPRSKKKERKEKEREREEKEKPFVLNALVFATRMVDDERGRVRMHVDATRIFTIPM